MATLNPQQAKTLAAFVTALSQQEEALPQGLQQQLNAIGQNLVPRVMELTVIAASLPKLNQAYQKALADTQLEGDKGATLVSTDQDQNDRFLEEAVKILTDPDPVQAAQHNQSKGIIAANPTGLLQKLFRWG